MRPREKLIKYGSNALTDVELMAIILRTGTKNKNVMQLAEEVIIAKEKEIKIDFTIISKIHGIGNAKACEILALLEIGKRFNTLSPRRKINSAFDIWSVCDDIINKKKEHLILLMLDHREGLIKKELISIGTINSTHSHPREIFEPAILNASNTIILCHNHPSGHVNPSEADIEITKRIHKAGRLLGIELVDHVIVSGQQWYSMRENLNIEYFSR